MDLDSYSELLEAYVTEPDESHLFAIEELGRQMVENNIPVEEIAEMHEEAFDRLVDLVEPDEVENIFKPLMELIISYSFAYSQKAEHQFRLQSAVLRSAANAIVITDPKGIVTLVNQAFIIMTGYTSDEVLGQKLFLLEPGESGNKKIQLIWDTITSGSVWAGEIVDKLKDDREHTLEMTITPVQGMDGQIENFVAIAQDVTERKEQEEQLQFSTDRLKTLHAISQAILEARSPEDIAEAALEQLTISMPGAQLSVLEFNLETEESRMLAVCKDSEFDPELEDHYLLHHFKDVQYMLQERSMLVEDIASMSTYPMRSVFLSEDIHKLVSVSMAAKGSIIGSLILGLGQDRDVEKESLDVIKEVASILAIAIHQANLDKEVERLAVTDELTGIFNRRQVMLEGQREFDRSRRYKKPFSIILFDLDNFKQVNDGLGHLAGDEVLREVAERCKQVIRNVDIFGRYGGDEFLIILPETSSEAANELAGRLRACLETPIQTGKGTASVSGSLGIAGVSEGTENLEALISRVDEAMYAAKEKGGNYIVTV